MPINTPTGTVIATAKPGGSSTPSWDVFLSHSSRDKGTATRLAQDLKELGHSVWIDYEKLAVGDLLPQEIGEAIRDSSALAVLWSASTDSSSWVAQELQAALVIGHRILLCLLDDTPFNHHPELVDRIWADFSHAYDSGLAQLMEGLAQFKREGATRLQPAGVERSPAGTREKIWETQDAILKELDHRDFRKAAALQRQLDPAIEESLRQWPYDPDIMSCAGYHVKNAVRIATEDGRRRRTKKHTAQLEEGERFFHRALAVEPGAMSALNGLGSIAAMQGNLEMAEHYCLRAIQQARYMGIDYTYSKEDLDAIRAEKQRRSGQRRSGGRTITVQTPLSPDGSTATMTYQDIAAAIPEIERIEMEQSLRSFKAHLDSVGLGTEVGGELRIEIRPDAPYEGAFYGDTGLIVMKPAWIGDKSVVFREYAHHALFLATRAGSAHIKSVRVDAALESGLADYFPCSFVGNPVMGGIGAPVAFNAPFIRHLENQETMDQYDAASRPQHKGQVWGGAFWEMRSLGGPQVVDQLLVRAWLAACRGKGDFETAFVTDLLAEVEREGGSTLLQGVSEILKTRRIKIHRKTKRG